MRTNLINSKQEINHRPSPFTDNYTHVAWNIYTFQIFKNKTQNYDKYTENTITIHP